MSVKRIITIDGPAGVGKSTLAKDLARELNMAYLDTGAMYRTIGIQLGPECADMDDSALNAALDRFHFSLCPGENGFTLSCNGQAVGEEIRTERAGRLASLVGALPPVRARLQDYQRAVAEGTPLVAEGRDMGTKVFPDAAFKFFLDARPEVRASRRYDELKAKGREESYEEILAGYRKRQHDTTVDALAVGLTYVDEIAVETGLLEETGILCELTESVCGALPFVLIAASEGTKVILGKKPIATGAKDSAFRMVKTGAAMGVGAAVLTVGGLWSALPATMGIRALFDRYKSKTTLNLRVQSRINRLEELNAMLRKQHTHTDEAPQSEAILAPQTIDVAGGIQ